MKSINIEIPEDILLSVKLPKKRIKDQGRVEKRACTAPV